MTDTTADRSALRDRIAAALAAEHYRRAEARIVASPEEHCAGMADAVLAVLPPPADRAAVLRWAADHIEDHELLPTRDLKFVRGADWALNVLRRMADETQAAEAQREPDPDCERCDGTGLDPDTYTVKDDVWTHQPCSECLPEDPEEQQDEPQTAAEHCVHDRAVHTRYHQQPVTGCPWCTAAEAQQDGADHVCNSVMARGHMDEPLGYYICGVCGTRKDGAQP